MFSRAVFLAILMCALFACVSVENSGREYFQLGNKVQGVEPADALIERMNKDRELREITYGQLKSAKIVQCTILRNQLYVAAMKGKKTPELLEAVKLMEMAYQDNDKAFLAACDTISETALGKAFLAIQQQYLIRKNS